MKNTTSISIYIFQHWIDQRDDLLEKKNLNTLVEIHSENDQRNQFQKCPKSTKTHVSTMDDLFNFWCFWNRCFCSFSQGYEVLILRFHLYPTHSFKDEKSEHLSWNALGKMNKNIDLKNIKKWINRPWLIHDFLLILVSLFSSLSDGVSSII